MCIYYVCIKSVAKKESYYKHIWYLEGLLRVVAILYAKVTVSVLYHDYYLLIACRI